MSQLILSPIVALLPVKAYLGISFGVVGDIKCHYKKMSQITIPLEPWHLASSACWFSILGTKQENGNLIKYTGIAKSKNYIHGQEWLSLLGITLLTKRSGGAMMVLKLACRSWRNCFCAWELSFSRNERRRREGISKRFLPILHTAS